MRFWIILICSCVIGALCWPLWASTPEAGELPPAVALYGDVQKKIHFIFDMNNNGHFYPGGGEIKTLTVPSQPINPWTSVHRGKFYVTTDNEGKKVTEFGRAKSYTVEEFWLYTVRRGGLGENAIGCDSLGKIWAVDQKGTPTEIGSRAYRLIKDEKGMSIRVLVHKTNTPGSHWVCDRGGKILQLTDEGTLKQLGWVNWRVIILPNGNRTTILMTKGMKNNSKWTGRHQGVLYRDK